MFFIPVKLRIKYDETPSVYFRYLFFKYTVLPEKKSEKRSFSKRVFEKLFKGKHKKPEKKKKAGQTEKKKSSVSDKLDFIKFITELLTDVSRKFLSHLKIKLSVVNITVATDDPAKTAITYGMFSQATAYFLEILDNIVKVKRGFKSDINVYADFLGSETTMKIDVSLYYRPIRAIGLIFTSLLLFMKRKEKNNQHKTEE